MKVSIPVSLADVKEPRPVPAGKYDLTIASCEDAKSKAGKPQLIVSIGIDGHDDAPNVTHYVSLPSSGDEKNEAKALFLTRFLEAFNISHEDMEFDTDDFAGATARLELTLGEPDDNGNVYNRLNLPKLKDNTGSSGGGRVAPKPPKR